MGMKTTSEKKGDARTHLLELSPVKSEASCLEKTFNLSVLNNCLEAIVFSPIIGMKFQNKGGKLKLIGNDPILILVPFISS